MQHNDQYDDAPRTGPRFELLSNLSRHERPDSTAPPEQVTWRLVAGNNRSLGRAGRLFDSVPACLVAAERLHNKISEASTSFEFHPAGPTGTSFWSWTMRLGVEAVAESTYNYQRRLECVRAQANFAAAAQTATPSLHPVRRLGRRLTLCTA